MTPTPSTDERIRSAAIELFAERGFAGTGIRDLADRVGITTASLYHHVAGKDDLLDRIIDTSLGALIDVGRHWEELDSPVPLRCAGLIASHVTLHALAPAEAVVVDRQLGAMRAGSRRRAVRQRDRYERIWRSLISEGTASGEFRVDDPALATLALLGATTAVADWYRPDGSLSVEKLARSYVDMSMQLLGAEPVDVPDIEPALTPFLHRWEPT